MAGGTEVKSKLSATGRHHIHIFFSEKDDGYIADIPDPSFCSSFGETPEQALAKGLKAN